VGEKQRNSLLKAKSEKEKISNPRGFLKQGKIYGAGTPPTWRLRYVVVPYLPSKNLPPKPRDPVRKGRRELEPPPALFLRERALKKKNGSASWGKRISHNPPPECKEMRRQRQN